jgi:hypothetical protein
LRQIPVRRATLRQQTQLSWGYSPFRSIIERGAITRIGYVNPLHPYHGSCGFPAALRQRFTLWHNPPVGFHSPTEHHRECLPWIAPRSALLRFFPLRRIGLRDPLFPGLPHPVRCAYRFSQPLSALLPRSLPAFFRAGTAHGVSSLQSFHPLPSQATLSGPPAFLPLPSPCGNGWLQGLQPGKEPTLLAPVKEHSRNVLSWV